MKLGIRLSCHDVGNAQGGLAISVGIWPEYSGMGTLLCIKQLCCLDHELVYVGADKAGVLPVLEDVPFGHITKYEGWNIQRGCFFLHTTGICQDDMGTLHQVDEFRVGQRGQQTNVGHARQTLGDRDGHIRIGVYGKRNRDIIAT